MEKQKLNNTEDLNGAIAARSIDTFSFYSGNILIPGVAVGLPGTGRQVFASSNFDAIIAGTNMIEPLPLREKKKMADKNVIRLLKESDGNARFVEINSTEDVIQLAGQLGYFDLQDEYGIKHEYDLAMALAIGAGIEALKDASIPLVMQYKETSTGKKIPDGYVLPREMQDSTGVILSSVFSNSETIINEMTKFFYHKFYINPYEEFENVYYHLMEIVKNQEVKQKITAWFFEVTEKRNEYKTYQFDRNFILNFCPLGAAHFAQYIKAKGPNLNVNGACASTTEAIAVGEDWIRRGRCDRVIIIGGESPTSPAHNQWIGTSFLAFGAGSVKKTVAEAAKPFDETRNGTILGSGAVSVILEKEACVKQRGLNGQAQLMGTHLANSAYHALNIDVKHLADEMKRFLSRIETMYNLDQEDYTSRLLLMSHETYTPARGGSADAEVLALKTSFPDHYKKVVISNTKGFTGHTLGAGIEDAVLVKSMQKGKAPPIANLTRIPEDFKDLNLNRNPHGDYEYGFHMAAGFGSHLAFVFFKRIYEKKTENNPEYKKWLQQITCSKNPSLTLIDNTLCATAQNDMNGI